MSQARRTFKSAAVSKDASATKAADDSHLRNNSSKHEKQRSRNTNKIPKSIRYDLENSLIGLCDVWFDEIKPHLVRNNIKLHVHKEDSSAATNTDTSCGSGDYKKRQLPGTSSLCTHIDPGAAPHVSHAMTPHHISVKVPRRGSVSYVGCSTTPPTVSAVPCHKLAMFSRRQRQPPVLSPILSQGECVQNQRHSSKIRRGQRPYTIAVHINNKIPTPQPLPGAGRRITRLCNTIQPTATMQAGRTMPSANEADVGRQCKYNKVGGVGLRPNPEKRKQRFQKPPLR